ncbi:type I phosphomannose isomerase catalytic subunit [Flavobacterium capsici]|uniref:Phosphohexomutase n=1 Tax=Flavobacterium capsici TaxID=3075618 RepID=A0AA96F0Q6_9FLAO|nr:MULTISPECIES: type I phosphomannose isomerase catalytic subunit [unclassified Flavobacterium]WNM20289.1 type I phosphomannose isomerase catalytic subunit [Flavobacterium sp. PMR2A8]WNM21679.1 type I phosphomannose isomerase catalytic subunit [Flavobacterium sp. PMTSA4]
MNNSLYPLQFEPILKERIWGGTKLRDVLNKPITSDITGESWEISTVQNDVSIVSNGIFKGKSLNELIDKFPLDILGEKVISKFGKQFPLLFKFLDAREDLSIQVHPNDKLANKRHNSFGKTEMWYVMQADDSAKLIVGFKEKSSREEYLKHLNENTLVTILDTKEVKKGDVFFLATGTVHAIGAGTLIAEIQQTSDITYRLYDFDRVDANGNKRELHIDLALDAINYDVVASEKEYSKEVNVSNEIVNCDYFTTHFVPLNGNYSVKKNKDSFYVYMCVEGEFELEFENQKDYYKKGDSILIPASINDYSFSGKASLLEIYIS